MARTDHSLQSEDANVYSFGNGPMSKRLLKPRCTCGRTPKMGPSKELDTKEVVLWFTGHLRKLGYIE